MTDNLSIVVRQDGSYKHYKNCEIKNISARCNDCDFYMVSNTGSFKSWQMDMLHAHVKSGHSTNVTYDIAAEKIE